MALGSGSELQAFYPWGQVCLVSKSLKVSVLGVIRKIQQGFLCAVITLYDCKVVGSFSKKLFCLKRLPLYTFSSFKAHTKFPRRKSIRELPEHILWMIKKESNRVLENYGVQSLSNSSGHHVVHITQSTLMVTQESIYK